MLPAAKPNLAPLPRLPGAPRGELADIPPELRKPSAEWHTAIGCDLSYSGRGDRAAIVDAIGDVLVCLVNVAALTGTSLEECCEAAWEQIKDRRGRLLPNGVFVKEVAE